MKRITCLGLGLMGASMARRLLDHGSPIVKMVVERMVSRDYTPNFLVPLMIKDLSYAMETFAAEGIELADARAARERFIEAMAAGYHDRDIAAVVEPLRRA